MRERISQYKHSMSAEFLRLMAAAALCAGLLYVVLGFASSYIMTHHFEGDAYVKQKNEQQVEELIRYVKKYQVSVEEKAKLTKWMKKHPLVSMQVFKDGTLQYDSAYPDLEDTWSVDPDDYYGWQTYYTVEFVDGKADVFISGYYGYRFSILSMVVRILLAVVLFLLIVVWGIRKTLRYIGTLSREISILESGDLDYEITIAGQNELADLARGLNAMRASLKERMESENQIMRDHAKLITEMSHDLRTPLTSVLVYTEILKKHAYQSEEQFQYYIEKIETKGIQMKQRTDNLFEYALIGSKPERELSKENFTQAFAERISDMCAYLGEKHYEVKVLLEEVPDKAKVQIDPEYLDRIFDNLVSNILKYGDKAQPIRIEASLDKGKALLTFENQIAQGNEEQESHDIGLKNIESMMHSMGGSSHTEERGGTFKISLRFPMD